MRDKVYYLFHGGCHGCENDISVCPDCCYMEADWRKRNLNTADKKHQLEHKEMVEMAKKLHISTDWLDYKERIGYEG